MSSTRAAAFVFAACALTANIARANDSEAVTSIGGLTFTKSDSISMDSEDLFISREHVRVKYHFTNRSNSSIDTLVAFPLPDIPPYSDDETNYWGDAASGLKFKTTVNGKPLALTLVEQAIYQGEDISSRLAALHIPLNRFADSFGSAIDRLAVSDRDRLVADGLIHDENGGNDKPDWVGLWALKTTLTRHQTFPAHKTVVVEHEYVPMAGGSVGVLPDAQERHQYCVDHDWLLSLDKKSRSRNKDTSSAFSQVWLGYVLKTGANWKGPIGDFCLVVDKGNPDSLVSFCADGVKKISPTQFEVHRTNFTPTSDLDILIIDWNKE